MATVIREDGTLVLDGGREVIRNEGKVHVDPRNREAVAEAIAKAISTIIRSFAPEDQKGREFLCPGCTMISLADAFEKLGLNNIGECTEQFADTLRQYKETRDPQVAEQLR